MLGPGSSINSFEVEHSFITGQVMLIIFFKLCLYYVLSFYVSSPVSNSVSLLPSWRCSVPLSGGYLFNPSPHVRANIKSNSNRHRLPATNGALALPFVYILPFLMPVFDIILHPFHCSLLWANYKRHFAQVRLGCQPATMVRLSCFCASFTYYCDAAFFCANCLTFLVNFAFFCVILPCPALHVISLLPLHFFLHSYSGGKFVEGPLKLGHCLIRWKAKLRFLEGDRLLLPCPRHQATTVIHWVTQFSWNVTAKAVGKFCVTLLRLFTL